MDIVSDSTLSRTAAVFFAAMSALQIVLSFFFQKIMLPSLALGFVFLLLSLACFTYRHTIHIDLQNDVLEQHRSALFWEHNEAFLCSSFESVGVAAIFSKGLKQVHLAYLVELRGRASIALPGLYFGAGQASISAAALAARLGLSLQPGMRKIFVGR